MSKRFVSGLVLASCALFANAPAFAKGKKPAASKDSCWVAGAKDKKAKTSAACTKAGGTWGAAAPAAAAPSEPPPPPPPAADPAPAETAPAP